jgi:hypothetical protein
MLFFQVPKLLENSCSFSDHSYTERIGQEAMSVGLNSTVRFMSKAGPFQIGTLGQSPGNTY